METVHHHVYCLFCTTQRCAAIAEVLERCGIDRAFSPQIIGRQRKQGELLEKSYDLLPGYIFLFTREPMKNLAEYRWIQGIVRDVGRPEDDHELIGSDRAFAEALFAREGVVSPLSVVREGEHVRMMDPLFQANHGVITRLDARKQRARVEFVFDGMTCSAWVAVNLLRL